MSKAQTHLILRSLRSKRRPDKDVKVFFSVKPVRKMVLFIHGYGGNAMTTWSDFPAMLPQRPKFEGHDLFFYGYDGLRSELAASASLFRDFLDRLCGDTSGFVNQSLSPAFQRRADFGYDEILIVGHSLGAVITRKALLSATQQNKSWVKRIKIMFYAPAHRGADVGRLALESVSVLPFLKWIPGAARIYSPLIDQLRPDSEELKKLLSDTQEQRKNGNNQHLKALGIIYAERENVVKNWRFDDDPEDSTIPDTTHTSVCKPKRDRLDPLMHLEALL